MKELISFEEARRIVLSRIAPLGSEDVSLDEALGRTLSHGVVSRDDIPPFDNSAMDGFAVRSSDLQEPGTPLRLAGEVSAGSTGRVRVKSGNCVRIMTGAPLPDDADAVVPVEKAAVEGDFVSFSVVPSPGDHVRIAGGDVRKGTEVLAMGTVVHPPQIGLLAALGYGRVPATRMPSVALVTTGDELIDPTETLSPGKIRDANGPALAAMIRSAGGRVSGRYRARDDREDVRRTLRTAAEADVLLISGGVSVGEYDFVRDELVALGIEMLFWRVRQRPGKPLAFGLLGGRPVFGLPGNPVSSAVCFEVYVRPALAAMLGRRTVLRPLAPAVLGSEVPKVGGLHTFARGICRWTEAGLVVEPTGPQGSHVSSSLAAADGLIHLEEGLSEAPAGTRVMFERLDW